MTPTARLLAAVEAGELPARADCIKAIWNGLPGSGNVALANERYRTLRRAHLGSTDAAISLIEALLPGWMWNLESGADAIVWTQDDPSIQAHGFADTPARALLIAALRALVDREGA